MKYPLGRKKLRHAVFPIQTMKGKGFGFLYIVAVIITPNFLFLLQGERTNLRSNSCPKHKFLQEN